VVVDTARMDATGVVSAQPAGELRLGQRCGLVLPMTGRRWLVQCHEAGELLVVDQRLQPIWRLQVPAAAGWSGIHAVAEDLSLVALSLEEHVLLLDGAGRQLARLAHQPTGPYDQGCCVFAGDGRHLWATVTWESFTDEVPRGPGKAATSCGWSTWPPGRWPTAAGWTPARPSACPSATPTGRRSGYA
jgi:hypothetical protein